MVESTEPIWCCWLGAVTEHQKLHAGSVRNHLVRNGPLAFTEQQCAQPGAATCQPTVALRCVELS